MVGFLSFSKLSDSYIKHRDNWARTISPNPNVKILIGAPASSSAAGGGYQPPNVLANIATITRNSFPSFGGIMLWDASQAYGMYLRFSKVLSSSLNLLLS